MEKSKLHSICVVLIILILTITSCATGSEGWKAEDVTIEAIIDANSADALLANHGSVLTVVYGEYNEDSIYISADYCANLYGDFNFMADAYDNWFYYDDGEQMRFAYRWFVMSEEEKLNTAILLSDFSEPVIGSEYTLLEKIENVEDNGDGTLTVTTRMESEYASEILRQEATVYPDEFYSADILSKYILDKESLEILSYAQYIDLPDNELPYVSVAVTHDPEQPEDLKAMIAFSDEFRSGEGDLKTVTVVYDYGTDQEETYEMSADSEFRIIPVFKSGYDYIYTDPERKTPYVGAGDMFDCTVYAFREE